MTSCQSLIFTFIILRSSNSGFPTPFFLSSNSCFYPLSIFPPCCLELFYCLQTATHSASLAVSSWAVLLNIFLGDLKQIHLVCLVWIVILFSLTLLGQASYHWPYHWPYDFPWRHFPPIWHSFHFPSHPCLLSVFVSKPIPFLRVAESFVPKKYQKMMKNFNSAKDCHKIKCGAFWTTQTQQTMQWPP